MKKRIYPTPIENVEMPERAEPLAEIGVLFLLFLIGLEFSLDRLWSMRRMVFGTGSAAGPLQPATTADASSTATTARRAESTG